MASVTVSGETLFKVAQRANRERPFRMRGSLIALALLLVFIAAATWYVWHVGTQVVAPRHGGTPTPTDTRP